jgi:hypothetical protein
LFGKQLPWKLLLGRPLTVSAADFKYIDHLCIRH